MHVQSTDVKPLQIIEDKVAFDEILVRYGDINFLGSARSNYEVTINFSGQMIFQNKALDTGDNEFIWIMDQNKKMYGLFIDPEQELGMFHSSLLGDDWPIAAGTLETDFAGNLVSISNNSGHFIPPIDNLEYAVNIIKEKGIEVSPSIVSKVNTPSQSLPSNIIINDQPNPQELTELNLALPTTIKSYVQEKHPRANLTVSEYKEMLLARDNEFDPLDSLPKLQPTLNGVLNENRRYLRGDLNNSIVPSEKSRVSFTEEGLLKNSYFMPSQNTKYTVNWVLNSDGKMYIIPTHNTLISTHSNFVYDDWPISSGEMTIKSGTILSINNKSIFFKPTQKSFEQALVYLRQRIVPIDHEGVELISYNNVSRLPKLTIQEYRANLRSGKYFKRTYSCLSSF